MYGADLVGELGRDKVEAALESLEFFVLIDLRRSETSLYADVLLPASSFAETDGTFTNHAGRVQRFSRAFEPPGDAKEGWSVLAALLAGLGDSTRWEGPEQVFMAMAGEAGAFSGSEPPNAHQSRCAAERRRSERLKGARGRLASLAIAS